ncbi:MAG: hypothetical protein R6V35_01840 [Candidatus Nanohaloarchaea archaeon]
MIREYAPIGLIPAAWAMTFATIIYPRISTYWIQHMHYFMILFLAGFTVLSWKEMESNPVLDIWRKVIGAGILFTGLGALSFTVSSYSQILSFTSLAYWFLAPGIALYYSSKYMDEYSGLYEKLGGESVVGFAIFVLGLYSEVISLQIIGIAGIAVVQTYSILIASKLDS